MKIRWLIACIIMLSLWSVTEGQTITPYLYWTFDRDSLADMNGNLLDIKRYKLKISRAGSIVNKGLEIDPSGGILVTRALTGKIKSAVTVEFCYKGSVFNFQSFATPNFMIRLAYPFLRFITISSAGTTRSKDDWIIRLNGIGKKSYDYYTDGQWHHIAFVVDVRKGIKQIYIDGELPEGFSKSIPKGDQIVVDGFDGFRTLTALDELAFYKSALPADLIAGHYQSLKSGNNYTFTVPTKRQTVPAEPTPVLTTLDKLEFAPGYPNYTIQASEQLKYFPDPRFYAGQPMKRNFPWLDISYLHRELPGNGGKGFGKISPSKAVEITDEMVRRWNYYIELPCLRVDSTSANKRYSSPEFIENALVNYANKHPELPAASVIMQVQGRPIHAGFDHNKAYENAQDLADAYYLRDASGKVILSGNKKWLSPLAPLDIIKKDAFTTAFYLRQLSKHLNRPIDMLNDNGELFGHMRPESLLKSDPKVKRDIEVKKLTNPQYNGLFQNRLDTCYKNELLRLLGWKKTWFTFYNVSAFNAEYWPDYAMRRTSNFVINGNHYSTPSFYPSSPGNWQSASGPNNGYGAVAQGRLKEIAIGDKFFAPFVSAGWSFEDKNIRPAQWLALLKSMVMLGAEFFHVGYFNVTGGGGWPDGAGPFDPRGYAYQVAMPIYAQAIASRVFPFLRDGELLNPRKSTDKIYPFRFAGTKENQLLLVRRLGKKYLIYGSIQPNTNFAGNVANEESTKIILDGHTLQFKIRRQGSMYVLDLTACSPVFYQLDGWHQYEHPWYWSKNIQIEAENADESSPGVSLNTEFLGEYDFSQFTTWQHLPQGGSIVFSYSRQAGQQKKLAFRIRRSGTEDAIIKIGSNKGAERTIRSNDWTTLILSANEAATVIDSADGRLLLKIIKGSADLDWICL